MIKEEWEKNLEFVVFGEDAWRILKIGQTEDGEPFLTYDLHGKTVTEAKREIHNLVNMTRTAFRLNVIHGYHGGTALKEMLAAEDFYGRLETRYCPANNPGETVMHFAA